MNQNHREEINDFFLDEIRNLAIEMGETILPLIRKQSTNITLESLSYMNAAIINHILGNNPDELKNATNKLANSLVRDMEILIGEKKQCNCQIKDSESEL